MNYKIECLIAAENHLGESPLWDDEEGFLYWVDGTGNRVGKPNIWRYDPDTGEVKNWTIDHDIGAMALRKSGGAVLALADGFYFFDFDENALELIEKIDVDIERTRLNDGKCDRMGRFYAGGMDDKEELAICGLWMLEPDLKVTKLDSGFITTNGPCWSPDNQTFYFADTFQQTMWAYDYDLETGGLSNRRDFASSKDDAGVYDGSTVDAEGYVWNAQVIGGEIVRYDPSGKEDLRIGMPVKNITSLIFGGDNLDEIYVTSMGRVLHPANHNEFAKETKPQFSAGSLFRITGLGIKGIPEPRFGG